MTRSNRTLRVKANAKITLAIDVLQKLQSGYHEIEAVMQEIDLHDTVALTDNGTDQIRVTTTSAELVTDRQNLAWKAASEVRLFCNINRGVNIHIQKKIPVGGGLAGGSSDSAAVIRGLNRLWKLGLSTNDMVTIAGKVSMDSCFCVVGGTALVQGRGELVYPVPGIPVTKVVVANPGFAILTKDAYEHLDWTRIGKRGNSANVLRCLEEKDIECVGRNMHNDFEYSAFAKNPVISEIKRRILECGALGALMSGSGSSVFGILNANATISAFRHSLSKLCPFLVIARTVSGEEAIDEKCGSLGQHRVNWTSST